jgi:peptidoglycan-associated lipoprotein
VEVLIMRRALVFALTASAALLTACPSPLKKGECKSDKDCEAQGGAGKVCVTGLCAECATDAQCAAGSTCAANKCVPKPEVKAEPVAPKLAPGACNTTSDCTGGQTCQAGRCATPVDAACSNAAAFTVHFEFDKSAVGGSAPDTLKKLAACLQAQPARRLKVDGHCDDRGTVQYNLALGKRRAEAVKKYLADLGVATSIDTNTFGAGSPVCREATEACWAENRRAEFTVER